jgi:TetR/AcrR family transcriptional regulator, cholesterol catabolism regulator
VARGREREDSLIAERRRAAIAEGSAEYAAKRAQLLRVSADVFHAKGYAGATLGDIAAAFGTDRASLYYYVAGKADLYQEAVTDILVTNFEEAQRIVAQEMPVREKITELIRVILHSQVADYPYMQMYLQEDPRRLADDDPDWIADMVRRTSRLERLFIESLDEGIRRGELRPGISPVLMANAIFGMMMWTHRWWTPGRKYPEEQVIEAFTGIFLDGVSGDEAVGQPASS